jgi:arylsulfatase A-like enzyme
MRPESVASLLAAIVAACGAVFAIAGSLAAAENAARPNIVLFVTDDHRWDALGCAGNTIIRTPNIDELARRGARFTECFCTTSICATSRATLLAGQYARRHAIWDFGTMFSDEAFAQTFPAMLRKAGYRTGFIGKWGVGNKLPREQYDYFAGFPGQGRYYEPGESEHLTRKMAAQTQEFLDGCTADAPFFVQVSFKSPHCQDGAAWQFQYDKSRHAPLYADTVIPLPKTATEEHFARLPEFLRNSEARARWKVRFADEEMRQNTVKDYYRLITGVDEVVGEVAARLARSGWAGNTVVIFTSDNGFYLGEHGLAGKWFMHEESIRLPLVICDPRLPMERRGAVVSATALTIDVAPTILDLAGMAPPAAMQGRSLVPWLAGQSPEWREEWLYEHHFGAARIPQTEGVRTNRWKYVRYVGMDPPHEELYDVVADPHDERNLAALAEFSTRLDEMRARWTRLAREAR